MSNKFTFKMVALAWTLSGPSHDDKLIGGLTSPNQTPQVAPGSELGNEGWTAEGFERAQELIRGPMAV